jgi:hypothetical protein
VQAPTIDERNEVYSTARVVFQPGEAHRLLRSTVVPHEWAVQRLCDLDVGDGPAVRGALSLSELVDLDLGKQVTQRSEIAIVWSSRR